MATVMGVQHRPERKGAIQQDAEKVRQPVLFMWSVRSVWFVWLHETHQMDQITRQTGLVPHVQAIEVLAYHNSFSPACKLHRTMPNHADENAFDMKRI
jgi:hypothetical protein